MLATDRINEEFSFVFNLKMLMFRIVADCCEYGNEKPPEKAGNFFTCWMTKINFNINPQALALLVACSFLIFRYIF
jgi:hypothetical protein